MKNIKSITLLVFIAALSFSCNQNQENKQLVIKQNDTVSKETNQTTLLKIDGLTASPENFKLLFENEKVRVLEYTLQPGQKDSWHTHPPKVSYVVQGGKIKIYTDKGEELIFDEKAGIAEWSDYVGKHQVENIGSTTVKIVLTEVK